MDFTLDQSAREALRERAALSRCGDPVAVLSKRSPGFLGSDELQEAFNSKETDKLRDVAEREWRAAADKIEMVIDIFMYERSTVRGDQIVSIQGIDFELPRFVRDHLRGAILYFEDGVFRFRGENGGNIDLPF